MHIGFYTTIGSWGGSEELWSQTAAALLGRGHQVSVNIDRRTAGLARIKALGASGADIQPSNRKLFGRRLRRMLSRFGADLGAFRSWLGRTKPDFVVVSMGWHLDELPIAKACAQMNVPYGLLVQAASPYHWIGPKLYDSHRRAFANASACYFVSAENRDIMESNLAIDLSEATIVDNAFNVAPDTSSPWPDSESWRLACVGRINFESKGQDLLLRVLRREKWRSRSLKVSLWGVDEGHMRQVKDTIETFNLGGAITIGGFADDIGSVWATHHGLVLPSRFEGNPLAMIEAMVCARIPIVTDVGRARELVDDNRTGFIVPAPTVDMLDEALERAWNLRHDWQKMGILAKAAIGERHSMRPAVDFATLILKDLEAARHRSVKFAT